MRESPGRFARTNGGDPAAGVGEGISPRPSAITDDDGLTRKIVAGWGS
jgi:hypothetical protein